MDERLLALERALARDPADVRARLELGRALEREGSSARAFEILCRGEDPEVVRAREELFVRAGAPFTLDFRGVHRFRGTEDRVLLGRAPEVHVRVVDASVNRRACLVEHEGGTRFALLDLGGANGTWVGAERIERIVLAHGQRFRVCAPHLEVEFRLGWDGDWPSA